MILLDIYKFNFTNIENYLEFRIQYKFHIFETHFINNNLILI